MKDNPDDYCILCGTSLYATFQCGHSDKDREDYKENKKKGDKA